MGLTINKTNIKSQAGISVSTYDTRIDMLIPQFLSNLTEELKNEFIARGYNGNIYDTGTLTFTSTTITYDTDEIDINFQAGDFFRIYGTDYNNGLYQIKTIESGVITIETSKSMRIEEVTGYIALVIFPDEFLELISKYVKQSTVNETNVKKEKIDDTEIEYFAPGNLADFWKQNSSILNCYRRAFWESLFVGDD